MKNTREKIWRCHEVKVVECIHSTKSKPTFDVSLVTWERDGFGVSFGRAFNVGKRAAKKEALEQVRLYDAELNDKAGIVI